MVFGWILRRAEWKAAILADARRLIDNFHDQAYLEARARVCGRCIDGARTARY